MKQAKTFYVGDVGDDITLFCGGSGGGLDSNRNTVNIANVAVDVDDVVVVVVTAWFRRRI